MRYYIRMIGFVVLFLIVGFISCQKGKGTLEPQLRIGFSAQAEPNNDYPIKVRFTNTSEQADHYQWYFDNGVTSTQVSPMVEYLTSGVATVQLTVQKGALKQTVTKKIDIPFKRLSVAMIYFIPRDGSFNKALFEAIKTLNPLVQDWYNQQLGGKTYSTNSPIVDTIKSSRLGSEYGNSFTNFLRGVEQEVYTKLGTRLNRSEQVVLIFYPVGLQVEGIGWSTKKDGEERRTGLIAANSCSLMTSSSKANQYKGLWTVAHELGHALGLPHNLSPNSLMFGSIDESGYTPNVPLPSFPSCYLTQTDKEVLRASPFLR